MRPEKQFLLDEIKEKVVSAKALVFASYKKLEPNAVAGFRSSLAKSGGSLEVVRKRILMKATQVVDMTVDKELLKGHIAVFFADEDPIQTTKIIYQFARANIGILEVLGGHFDGVFCSAKDVEHISNLPNKDEMRAQFLGTLEAPLSQTLAVFEALMTSVIYCIDNKCQENNV